MNYIEGFLVCTLMEYFSVIWPELFTGRGTVTYMHATEGANQGYIGLMGFRTPYICFVNIYMHIRVRNEVEISVHLFNIL